MRWSQELLAGRIESETLRWSKHQIPNQDDFANPIGLRCPHCLNNFQWAIPHAQTVTPTPSAPYHTACIYNLHSNHVHCSHSDTVYSCMQECVFKDTACLSFHIYIMHLRSLASFVLISGQFRWSNSFALHCIARRVRQSRREKTMGGTFMRKRNISSASYRYPIGLIYLRDSYACSTSYNANESDRRNWPGTRTRLARLRRCSPAPKRQTSRVLFCIVGWGEWTLKAGKESLTQLEKKCNGRVTVTRLS